MILLIVNLLIGLTIFRAYGFSWDEPLFYDYGQASLYAYSPANWFSGNFDLNQSFGASAADHANRGPAYLILAAPFIFILEKLGLDLASAWHLVNYLTFTFGVYLLYRLASKWMSEESALMAAMLFNFQPLLWGHAFINPKDIPFLTFFLGAILFGFEMIDDWAQNARPRFKKVLLAAFFLGAATSIRVIAPFAALIVFVYGLVKGTRLFSAFAIYWLYAVLSTIIMFALWPYLWQHPLQRLIEVFIYMSDNPTSLNVLFASHNFPADALPRRYFPVLIGYTLTEPTYLLIAVGIIAGFWRADKTKRFALTLLLAWFGVLVAYILLRRPAMYDGYRHFLFILPPLFVFAGFAFEAFFSFIKRTWQKALFALVILAFGIIPIIRLHPYQYAYYNAFVGGVGGAFRHYETEYWLTCYREAVLELNQIAPSGSRLFVRREPYIAAYYADPKIVVRDFRGGQKDMQSGDYYLVSTRSNEDLTLMSGKPAVVEVSRLGAAFCLVKQVP